MTVTTMWRAAGYAVLVLALSGCALLGPPPMEPLTPTSLEAARQRWEAHGSESYHLVVRVRAPRFQPAVYDVTVVRGTIAAIERDGERVDAGGGSSDYSVAGLFELLREDLRLTDVRPVGDTPPIDLRASFEPETGRLVRYRRTVGSERRRVLLVEVLEYEPLATARLSAHA